MGNSMTESRGVEVQIVPVCKGLAMNPGSFAQSSQLTWGK